MIINKTSLNTIIRASLSVILVLLIIIALTSDFAVVLQSYRDQAPFEFFAVLFTLLLLTQVVAPLSGFSVYLVMVNVFGMEVAFAALTVAYLISSLINFYIARVFGRALLEKLLGNEAMNRTIYLNKYHSAGHVIVSRIVGYYFHDILSYLWGLTAIRLRRYFLGTLIGTIIATFAQYLLFHSINVSNRTHLMLFYVALIAISAASYLLWKKVFERGR